MILYSILMFLIAVLFFIMSVMIYKGKTQLIHDYHQTKITDRKAYGKAFGKALSVIAISLFFSGMIGLCDTSETVAKAAVSVLILGLFIGIACIFAVQKKYNGGIF